MLRDTFTPSILGAKEKLCTEVPDDEGLKQDVCISVKLYRNFTHQTRIYKKLASFACFEKPSKFYSNILWLNIYSIITGKFR